ncbi:MAG: hypothetical protein HFG44_09150 [Oscillospiraceae bacterium]|nr:hypothetical protein [Oscillospiraceae bacterium]
MKIVKKVLHILTLVLYPLVPVNTISFFITSNANWQSILAGYVYAFLLLWLHNLLMVKTQTLPRIEAYICVWGCDLVIYSLMFILTWSYPPIAIMFLLLLGVRGYYNEKMGTVSFCRISNFTFAC